ncbi:MAG: ABC transporter permease [Butyrivibrio sp.]|nr:ABC transporter permease [Butyrivibrio sp.]
MEISALFNAMPGAVSQGMMWGIMAIGVFITYKILDIADLSVDGTVSLGASVFALFLTKGQNIWLCMLYATLAGMLAGLVTGLFHTMMGIPAILAGIITQFGLYSINLKILGGSNMTISNRKYDLIESGMYQNSQYPFYKWPIFVFAVCAIILILVLYWFFGTERGASLRATGSNPDMSRAQGINTNVNKVIGLVLSNGIVAFSGALMGQYSGAANVATGRGAIVIGLAAVVIGNAIFGKIFKNFALKLLSVVLGGIIYYIIVQFILWFPIDPNLLKFIQAIIIAVFLAFPYWKSKIKKPVKIRADKEVSDDAGDK